MTKLCEAEAFIKLFIKKMGKDKIRAHSAESAFFIIISIFPFLLLLLSLLRLAPVSQEQVQEALEALLPVSVRGILDPVLEGIYSQSAALVSGTVFAAVWAAGKSVLGLTDGLNAVFGLEETRNYFIVRIRAACYTVVLVLALVVSLVIMVFGYRIRSAFRGYLLERFPGLLVFPDLGPVLPVLFAMVILTVLFLAMYVFLPDRRMRWSGQLPGAVFSSVSWTVFSYGFSVYISLAGGMSLIYGSMTTLAVVMLWLYGCMYLLFIGAELNHYLLLASSAEKAALRGSDMGISD